MSPVSLRQALQKAFHHRNALKLQATVCLWALVIAVLIGTAWNPAQAETVHVYITPATVSVPSAVKQQFTVSVTGSTNSSVTWAATQGSVSGSGLFTAPTVTSDTAVSVTATSVADPSASATAMVTVTPPVSVSISPATLTMNASRQEVFTATVSNTQQTRVTWSATAGTISGGGMFTSPNVSTTETVRVTATSVEDPTKSATATVTVMPPISVSVTPGTATVTATDTQQFTGVAQNATDPAVTWTATQGSVTGTGLFTAPDVLIKTVVTVTATSVEDPARVARAEVTVNPPTSAPLAVLTTALPGMPISAAYSFAMTATGGFTPYQWAVVTGGLPTGLILNSAGAISGSATAVGSFPVTIRVTDAGNHQVFKSYKLLISGSAKGQQIPMTNFGLHIDWVNTPWPNISFGTQRFWDSNTQWAQINTAPGVFDWTITDTRIATALANHVDILFDLARTPPFAQCASNNTACGSGNADWVCSYSQPGEGGPGQCFPPSDLNVDGTGANQYFIDWVTALATRYKGEIKYYEIWNEPTAPLMWQGTYPQLVRMTQDARCIVIGTGCSPLSNYTQRGIDPAAQITTPAFVTDTGIMVSAAMSSFLSAGGGQYVDVIAYHGYVQWPAWPEFAANDASELEAVLVANGQQNKPVFNTEGGYGASAVITDPDQESAWIARYFMLMQSMGIVRSYWYAWDGATTPFWTSATGTEIGGTTMAEMTQWMVGATLSSPCMATGTVWQCGYTRPGGYKALAVWDTSQSCNDGTCTTSTFTIPAGYDYYLDLSGVKTRTTGSTLQIGIKPLLLENQ